MSLGGEMTRGWSLASYNTSDNGSLGAVSVGFATVLLATGAGAQENNKQEPTPLPPLEVTAKKAPAKKKAVQKSAPAPVAAPAPVQAEQAEKSTATNPDAAFTPGSGNSLEAGTGIGRLPGSVQDQPQVVNVISQQQQREQNTTSVEQTLRNVPGVTVAIGEGGGGFNGDQFRRSKGCWSASRRKA